MFLSLLSAVHLGCIHAGWLCSSDCEVCVVASLLQTRVKLSALPLKFGLEFLIAVRDLSS